MTLLNGHVKAVRESGKALTEQTMERVFLFCLTWALGGLLEMKERPLLDQELRSFAQNMPPRCACAGRGWGGTGPPLPVHPDPQLIHVS